MVVLGGNGRQEILAQNGDCWPAVVGVRTKVSTEFVELINFPSMGMSRPTIVQYNGFQKLSS